MAAEAFYSRKDDCWYVPVSAEMFSEQFGPGVVLEPVRVELKDNQLWITDLRDDD